MTHRKFLANKNTQVFFFRIFLQWAILIFSIISGASFQPNLPYDPFIGQCQSGHQVLYDPDIKCLPLQEFSHIKIGLTFIDSCWTFQLICLPCLTFSSN